MKIESGEIEAQDLNHLGLIARMIVQETIDIKSRFILTSNVLDKDTLPDEQIVEAYKTQASSVENSFKFLKDPIFFAESFFVKKPSRVYEALKMEN